MIDLILPTSYLPSRLYFSVLKNHKKITIETKETFPKQTTRNRTFITTANGIQQLSVPLASRKNNSKTDEIKIDYKDKWQNKHWRAIESAYNSSPFFEYYKDEFKQLINTEYNTLLELNNSFNFWLIKKLKLSCKIEMSSDFLTKEQSEIFKTLSTKQYSNPDSNFANYAIYYQVFEDKIGFHPNLSAIDLLFNEGPSSNSFL